MYDNCLRLNPGNLLFSHNYSYSLWKLRDKTYSVVTQRFQKFFSAFIYRLFDENVSLIVGTNTIFTYKVTFSRNNGFFHTSSLVIILNAPSFFLVILLHFKENMVIVVYLICSRPILLSIWVHSWCNLFYTCFSFQSIHVSGCSHVEQDDAPDNNSTTVIIKTYLCQ